MSEHFGMKIDPVVYTPKFAGEEPPKTIEINGVMVDVSRWPLLPLPPLKPEKSDASGR